MAEVRLIDANALDCKLDALAKKYADMGRFDAAKDYSFVQTVLLSAPTIDPESLRPKGRWVTDENSVTYCEKCRHIDDYASVHNYCPNCGADMREAHE